uniref:Uncharacterized protein n=1 Tax=Arundo donax TaxID=35708 RepID=A0A0A9GX60_ARUDO
MCVNLANLFPHLVYCWHNSYIFVCIIDTFLLSAVV